MKNLAFKRENKTIFICFFFLLSLSVLFITFSRNKDFVKKDKALVYTSFFPIYDLTKTVADDDVDIRSFMPKSATVHDWEPSAKAINELSKADLLIVNGANLEKWVDSVRKNLPDLKIITLSDNVDLISYTGASDPGEFQLMQRANLEEKTYPIRFGHTHEDFLRIAFLKDDGKFTKEDLIEKGREILKNEGELIQQKDTIKVRDKGVYKITMGHESGEVFYKMPESGRWIIYTDRKPENILNFNF